MLIGTAGASAAVRLTTGSAYSGKSSVCPQPKVPGTTCVFKFKASRNGFGLRFVGHTVVSSWSCKRGNGGAALLGGKVIGNDPVPGLVLQPDGKLYGSTGHGPSKIAVTGHIAEAGTKVVLRFHLVHQHCVSPKVTLIEGLVPGAH
jgi:hypothetical protein